MVLHFNEDFLQGENSFNTVLGKVYKDVSFPFTKDAVFKSSTNPNDPDCGNCLVKREKAVGGAA